MLIILCLYAAALWAIFSKTIGDAFMAAAGLLRETKDPLGSAVRCGVQMATTSIDAQLGWRCGLASMSARSWPALSAKSDPGRSSAAVFGNEVDIDQYLMKCIVDTAK